MTVDRQDPTASVSTGLVATAADWLDAHFEASRPEYEAQVRAVGFQPRWRILDAGCGPGGFIPWLVDIVGPAGAISAIDLAPENLAAVEQRVASWNLPCPVEVRVAGVMELPYPDDSFDGVWCANVLMYLDDEECRAALAEFRRVVRPGGLVAIKESTGSEIFPLRPYLHRHLYEAGGELFRRVFFRTPVLRRGLERAGLEDVWQRRTTIDHWAPYTDAERRFLLEYLPVIGQMADPYSVAQEELAEWERVSDPESPANPANAPDGHYHEGNILAAGRVPGGA